MEHLSLSAPGLLFPAISLVMLAYTNRFLGLASVARNLTAQYRREPDPATEAQVATLRQRVALTKHMQTMGVSSLSLCVACMFVLFFDLQDLARVLFSGAMLLLLGSLAVSLRENQLSVQALDIEIARALGAAGSGGRDDGGDVVR